MKLCSRRGRPPANPSTTKETVIDNISSNIKYKKLSSEKHYCSFRCGWCELLGSTLIEQKYRDYGNILLEDDLSYNLFGRELVK